MAVLSPGLAEALGPVLEQIAAITVKIEQYDRIIKGLTETEYPETQALIQAYGVGQLTALTYVLTLGSKERFKRSRDAGRYLGLRPRRSQSGDADPQLGITKAGNVDLRTLLVECANHVLGPRGKDSTLRQWGLHLAGRGGHSPTTVPSSPSPQARSLASSHLGHARAIPPVLCSSCLRIQTMFTVAKPRVPMTALRSAFARPAGNWQHPLLHLTPT